MYVLSLWHLIDALLTMTSEQDEGINPIVSLGKANAPVRVCCFQWFNWKSYHSSWLRGIPDTLCWYLEGLTNSVVRLMCIVCQRLYAAGRLASFCTATLTWKLLRSRFYRPPPQPLITEEHFETVINAMVHRPETLKAHETWVPQKLIWKVRS